MDVDILNGIFSTGNPQQLQTFELEPGAGFPIFFASFINKYNYSMDQ